MSLPSTYAKALGTSILCHVKSSKGSAIADESLVSEGQLGHDCAETLEDDLKQRNGKEKRIEFGSGHTGTKKTTRFIHRSKEEKSLYNTVP
uniref:Uncharacterized protein n=1 Tax=Steinernema glaseri TaxID=37863 RepID=A0A1I7ZT56_9BILA